MTRWDSTLLKMSVDWVREYNCQRSNNLQNKDEELTLETFLHTRKLITNLEKMDCNAGSNPSPPRQTARHARWCKPNDLNLFRSFSSGTEATTSWTMPRHHEWSHDMMNEDMTSWTKSWHREQRHDIMNKAMTSWTKKQTLWWQARKMNWPNWPGSNYYHWRRILC